MAKAPPWRDKAAILKLVAKKLQEIEDNQVYKISTGPDVEWTKEDAALQTSKHGYLNKLVDMVLTEKIPSPAIRKRVTEFLTQKRSLRTGRLRGGQKKSQYTRSRMNPNHNAAEEFPLIKDILKDMYPKQSAANIRERAIAIAARRHGARETTLATHLQRARKNRRRI